MSERTAFLVRIVLAAAALAATPATAQGPEEEPRYRLEYRYEKGQRFRVRNSIEREAVFEGNVPLTQSNDEVEEWTVEVLEGGARMKLRLTMTRFSIDRYMNAMGEGGDRLKFDSAGLTHDEIMESVRREPRLSSQVGFLNRSYVVVIDPTGEVLGIEGLAEYTAGMREVIKEGMGDQGANAFDLYMMTGQAEKRLGEGVRIVFSHLPGQPVMIGEGWERKWHRSLPPLGRMQENAYLTLDEVEGAKAKVSWKSEAKYENVDPVGMTMPDWYKCVGSKEEASGRLEFDLETGMLLRFEGVASVVLTTDYPIPLEQRRKDVPVPTAVQKVRDVRRYEVIEILPPEER